MKNKKFNLHGLKSLSREEMKYVIGGDDDTAIEELGDDGGDEGFPTCSNEPKCPWGCRYGRRCSACCTA